MNDQNNAKGFDEREFGEHTFRTSNYNVEKSLRIMNDLGEIAGEGIGTLIGGFTAGDVSLSELESEVDAAFMGQAVKSIFANFGQADAPTVIRRLLSDTEIRREGDKGAAWLNVDLNRDFQDGGRVELDKLFDVTLWVLKQNYSDFFSKMRERGKQVLAALKSQN